MKRINKTFINFSYIANLLLLPLSSTVFFSIFSVNITLFELVVIEMDAL